MNNGRRAVVTLLALLLAAGSDALAATFDTMKIYLAPLVYQDDSGKGGSPAKPEKDVAKRLDAIELGQSIELMSDLPGPPPQTFLDAARLAETQGCPYLLYGYVKRTAYSYYAELKLIARDGKSLAATFIAGDDDQHYERMIDDLAAKLLSYLRTDLGLGPPPAKAQPARNVVSLPIGVGYWTPAGAGWPSALEGLVCADVGLRFVPACPLFALWGRTGYVAFGLDLEYALGENQPDLERFFLHTGRVRLPIEAMLELGSGHRIGLGVAPLFEMDTMIQAKEYASTVTETSIRSGVSLELLYQYALSKNLSLGLRNVFDFVFYSPPLVVYSPKLTVEIRLGASSEGNGHD